MTWKTSTTIDETGQSKTAALAPAPTPLLFADNPSCAKLNTNNPDFPELRHITADYELRFLTAPAQGTSGPFPYTSGDNRLLNGVPDPSNSVSFDTFANRFDFTSTKPVSAVIVRAGVKSFVYPYPAPTYDSQGLTTPDNGEREISQVIFCYYVPAQVTIIKQVQTFSGGDASPIPFSFTATNFGTPNFALTDNNSQPADRITRTNIYAFGDANKITVTEAAVPNWTLSDIVCTEAPGGGGVGESGSVYANLFNTKNSTYDLAARQASIILEQGENVTCIFKNVQSALNAAAVTVSGRVLNAGGLPVKRAAVSIFNANTLENKTVYTNAFGYYKIDGLIVNNYYIMSVEHGKKMFADSMRSFTLSDDLTSVDFIAQY